LVRRLFALKGAPSVAGRAAFLEDYDIALAGQLVAGCDLWVNLPRPPLEASGTSGMKSVLGGGLQLSVLDGWWAEAYDGSNGWAIDGREDADHQAQDWRDANALFELLERQVVPMFHERDAEGIPQRWVAMMRRSLVTHGPRFSATRMLREYADRIYRNG
jgi:glycogen phosphorylase